MNALLRNAIVLTLAVLYSTTSRAETIYLEDGSLFIDDFMVSTDTNLTQYITHVEWADFDFETNPGVNDYVSLLMDNRNDYKLGVELTHDYLSVMLNDVAIYAQIVPTPINEFKLELVNFMGSNTASFRGYVKIPFSSGPVILFNLVVPPLYDFAVTVDSDDSVAIFGDYRVFSRRLNHPHMPEPTSCVVMISGILCVALYRKN